MYEASFYFVQLDEMMNGIGAELGKLTGAEWGIATTGCEAAICLATIACIAGTDVERCQALPYIKGKDQVIIPKHSRNQYDVGVRMVGAEVVEVNSAEELRAKISRSHRDDLHSLRPGSGKGSAEHYEHLRHRKGEGCSSFRRCCRRRAYRPEHPHSRQARRWSDTRAASALRGPQSSGMLIGQKDLCKAAYYQAAPHHCYGRGFKCSKEEAMGLLAAVQQWYKRDHEAEQRSGDRG